MTERQKKKLTKRNMTGTTNIEREKKKETRTEMRSRECHLFNQTAGNGNL